ncbi:alanine racemase [Planococcus sp. CAU13]|uniref:alanine racemase n=1 Tax=Planococcus sp. CAU13 TaxID=1541197 RepID=UPI00052FF0DD|nr:alanine racemase [Planococcus sp. CAU13]
METTYRPTKAVIDLTAIDHNIQVLKNRANGAELMAVVKADGYGHGAVEIAQQALKSGAGMLAVATPDEALHLRNNGIDTEILVMGASPANFIEEAIKMNIAVTAYSMEWMEAAAAELTGADEPLKVHLKFDTGMRRIGFEPEQAEEAFAFAAKHAFQVAGLFTHFATADEADNPLFLKQVERIKEIRGKWQGGPLMFHVSNSAAAILHPELAFDAVRTGIALYGIAPSAYVEQEMPFELKQAMSLETELIHVKKVKKGEKISYGATYTSPEDEWIGTLPIGYADGLLRGLQGQTVLVKGRRMPIVGRICMDQCMIRLPEESAVGEKVQLLGSQKNKTILIEEWAEKLETIPYEIPCIITKRVPRFY